LGITEFAPNRTKLPTLKPRELMLRRSRLENGVLKVTGAAYTGIDITKAAAAAQRYFELMPVLPGFSV